MTHDCRIAEFGPPIYRDLPRTENLVLDRPYVIAVRNVCYVAPATGWPFDGASIPRLLWRVVGPPLRGMYRRGAVIHDPAYKGLLLAFRIDRQVDMIPIRDDLRDNPKDIPATLLGRPRLPIERAEADDLLRVISEWNGTSPIKAAIMRRAVRLFGGGVWRAEHAKWAHLQNAVQPPDDSAQPPKSV